MVLPDHVSISHNKRLAHRNVAVQTKQWQQARLLSRGTEYERSFVFFEGPLQKVDYEVGPVELLTGLASSTVWRLVAQAISVALKYVWPNICNPNITKIKNTYHDELVLTLLCLALGLILTA